MNGLCVFNLQVCNEYVHDIPSPGGWVGRRVARPGCLEMFDILFQGIHVRPLFQPVVIQKCNFGISLCSRYTANASLQIVRIFMLGLPIRSLRIDIMRMTSAPLLRVFEGSWSVGQAHAFL